VGIVASSGASRDWDEIEALVGHEVAHLWLSEPVAALEQLESTAERTARDTHLVELAVAHGRVDLLARLRARDERLVARCVKSWGFVGLATNEDDCAASAHALVRHEATRLG